MNLNYFSGKYEQGLTTKLRLLPLALVVFISTILLTSCNEPKLSHLEQIKQRGLLKVVTRNSPTTYYERADGFAGMEYELVESRSEERRVGKEC